MPRLKMTWIFVLILMLSGCATAGKSALFGAGVGSTVGASLGVIVNQNEAPHRRTQGAIVGAALGGLVGALIGHESHKTKVKKEGLEWFDANSARIEVLGAGNANGQGPRLKPARVRVRYVEDQVKDGVFIPAHFEYEIVDQVQWERSK